jgi:hypothetical protein
MKRKERATTKKERRKALMPFYLVKTFIPLFPHTTFETEQEREREKFKSYTITTDPTADHASQQKDPSNLSLF